MVRSQGNPNLNRVKDTYVPFETTLNILLASHPDASASETPVKASSWEIAPKVGPSDVCSTKTFQSIATDSENTIKKPTVTVYGERVPGRRHPPLPNSSTKYASLHPFFIPSPRMQFQTKVSDCWGGHYELDRWNGSRMYRRPIRK